MAQASFAILCCFRMLFVDFIVSVSSALGSSVKLQASLQGLGPVFRVKVTVRNSGAHPLHAAALSGDCDPLAARHCCVRCSCCGCMRCWLTLGQRSHLQGVRLSSMFDGPLVNLQQLGLLNSGGLYSKHVYISCNEPVVLPISSFAVLPTSHLHLGEEFSWVC